MRGSLYSGIAWAMLPAGLLAAEAAPREAPLDEAARAYLCEADDAKAERLLEALLRRAPPPDRVAEILRRGAPRAARGPGEHESVLHGPRGPFRCHVWVPGGYSPERPCPVLVHLHGGVWWHGDGLHRRGATAQAQWGAAARERGFLLAAPAGWRDASWFNAAGRANLLLLLEHLRRTWRVDEDRVYLTGYSSGGAGCFEIGRSIPTPFTAFVPVAGSLPGNGLTPDACTNLPHRPWYAVLGGNDPLYCARKETERFARLRERGVPIEWEIVPEAGHDVPAKAASGMPGRLLDWMGNRRRTLPKTLEWETEDLARPGIDWLDVTRLGDGWRWAFDPEPAPPLADGFSTLGLHLKEGGPGIVLVDKIDPGTWAVSVDLQPGDRLVRVGGRAVAAPEQADAAFRRHPGPAIRLDWTQGKHDRTAFAIRNAEPSGRTGGRIRAEVDKNRFRVHADGVREYRLWLIEGLCDLSREIEVYTNGSLSFRGRVEPDLRLMLTEARRRQEFQRPILGKLEIAR